MNHADINSHELLQEIIDETILITGDLSRQKEEIFQNFWELWFDNDFVKTLTMKDLENFLKKLIANRCEQVRDANKGKATFYFWYNDQYGILCFDVLSGTDIPMPFGCKVNVVHNPIIILKNFSKEVIQAEIPPMDLQNFKILEPGDPDWDKWDDNEGVDPNYVLDVFVMTLPQSNIDKFLRNLI